MTLSWGPSNLLQQPLLQIQDGNVGMEAVNTEALSLQQAAADYGDQSPEQTPRTVQVREISTSNGIGQWQSFAVPYVPPPPLVNLAWMQSNPTWEQTPWVHVLDGEANFCAPNPEGWDLEKAARDYGIAPVPGYEPVTPICENREPHQIQIRLVGANIGTGPWYEFTVPDEEE